MAEVKLFGLRVSPFSLRVEIALKLKGVEYEYVEEDLKNKSSLLLKYNPVHRKIPVLVHNGKAIAESLLIVEYIDETFDGPALLPVDPYERAKARFWARIIDEKCGKAIRKACLSSGEEQEKGKEDWNELLQFLEDEVKGKKFFGGDTIGLVDIAAIFLAYWVPIIAELVGIELLSKDRFPNLHKWIDEYTNSSFVKENVPPKDKIIEKMNAHIQAATSA